MPSKDTNLIWIDLEMTGLRPERDVVLEIATIITDEHLNILAEGPVLAIHQPDEQLAKMDKWNVKTHTGSGLIERIKKSSTTVEQAEQETLAFIKEFVNKGQSPICGNSICQDRRFLYQYMPILEDYFHYRHLDVSTIKVLAERWAPKIRKGFEKDSKHQALQDIKDSIDELKYYREHFFIIS